MTTLLTVVELVAKCGVAAVLITSGYAKLVGQQPTGGRALPSVLSLLDRRAGRLGLGAAELTLGSVSLLALGSPFVDAAALALCAAFFVGSALLGLTQPGTACQCFGAASTSAFGLRHTLLTGALAAAAAIGFVGSLDGAGTPAWSWHPLMLVTLVGVLVLADRVRRLPDPAGRRLT